MTDNISKSSIPSENETLSNGTHKSTNFSREISITESVIANVSSNLQSMKREKINSSQTNVYTTWEKSYLPASLIILMCMIVIMLQIPTVLYYTDPPSAESMHFFDSINLETCSIDNPELLDGSFNTALQMLCNVSRNYYNNTKLKILKPVYHLSFVVTNNQCSQAILQFFCNWINIIDDESYNLIKECFKMRDDTCAAEWRIAENFFNFSLPDCSSLNSDGNFVTARAPVLRCPDDYGTFCGSICQPLCDKVSLFNDAATAASKVLNIIFHTICLIGGVVTLFVCCLRKRKMFSFPLIFVVYNTITLEVISLFMLLPYIVGSDDLLCSHPNLIVSNAKSTMFCQIQGLVTQTGSMIFFGFWLCHLSYLLFSLKYPFKVKELMKSTHLRNIHVVEVVITLVCALLPGIIIVSTSGYQHFGFPPLCVHKIPEVLFYTFIFPISIGATVGLSMLLLSIVILRKHHYVKEKKIPSRRLSMREMIFTSYSVPETKLIILFSYYGITIILLLIRLTVTLRTRDTTAENITNLTVCSAGGHRAECNEYRETLNSNLTPAVVFELISTLFSCFANIINLLYVLQCNDFKVFICKRRVPKS